MKNLSCELLWTDQYFLLIDKNKAIDINSNRMECKILSLVEHVIFWDLVQWSLHFGQNKFYFYLSSFNMPWSIIVYDSENSTTRISWCDFFVFCYLCEKN